MKKIIFINNLGLGGAERVVSRLFLDEKIKDNVELWTLNTSYFYSVGTIKYKCLFKFNTILTFVNALMKLFSLSQFTIVQCHLNKTILISCIANLFTSKIIVQPVHCFAYSSFYKNKGSKYFFHKKIFSFLLKKADCHIFKAHEMVDDFEDVFGWRPKSYDVIYNPYNIDEIKSLACEIIEENTPFEPNIIDVAIIGRLNPSKRPLDVLAIAEKTADFARFHFFGDGDMSERLLAEVKSRRLKNVIFHGKVANPFKYLKKYGYYLSTSESEGFPNALVEAMICGAIPVQSNCKTGPKEILSSNFRQFKPVHNEYSVEARGILFNVGDIDSAVKALTYLKDNSAVKDSFSNNSQLFLQSLSLASISHNYLNTLIKNEKKH